MLVLTRQRRLFAVLTRLSGISIKTWPATGIWKQASEGLTQRGPHHATFADLDAAQRWINRAPRKGTIDGFRSINDGVDGACSRQCPMR